MSDQGRYFTFGTAVLVMAGIVVAINAALYDGAVAADRAYAFWASPAMWVAYVLAVIAALLFIAGVRGTAFPPWKRVAFPELEIEVGRVNAQDTPAHKTAWQAFHLRVTNRDNDQTASLSFLWRGKLKAGHMQHLHPRGEDWGETLYVVPGSSAEPPAGFPTGWLTAPLNVPPRQSMGGIYVAAVDRFWLDGLAQPVDVSLLVEDHTSMQAVAIPARIGLYNRANWRTLTRDDRGYWTVYGPDAPSDSGAQQ